ncbi:LAETG motif-containing sortase-dependent surface protein [Streptomyces sp. NPDC014623]|uniref:LAETG motif-containing sortase-dependent surface protein n=1 Tax=Streptomyces sp. NPDC014623 TaxID=3364875 RepID=UPI0036FC7F86
MKTSALGRITLAAGIAALTAGVVPATAYADDATVERKTLPVLVEFTDSAFEHPDQVKAGTPESYFGTGDTSLAQYLSDASRGRYKLVPAVEEKVIGPIKLPMSAAGCKHGDIRARTTEALAARGLVQGEDYDSLAMTFPAQATKCPWAGLATMPGPITWFNLYGTGSALYVLGHEFGHNLGFGHQGRTTCTDGDLVNCKDNGASAKSLLGNGNESTGFSAPEHIRAGWLNDSEAPKITESGTYTLRSLHGEGGGVRALDIPMGEDRLVVEYRHEAGRFDTDLEGVHAYRVPKDSYGSASLIDMTEANKTSENDAPADADAITSLTDEAGKVSVAVMSSGDGRATVQVALDGDELTDAPAEEETAKPDPEHTGTDTVEHDTVKDTGAGDSAGSDAETQSDGSKPAAEAGGSSEDLAATGGSSATLPVAVGGAALVAAGTAALVVMRRRKRA